MAIHVLKTWPSHFSELRGKTKTAEIRKNDRDYVVGDILELREFSPNNHGSSLTKYSGCTLRFKVTHILSGEQWGLMAGYVMLSLSADW